MDKHIVTLRRWLAEKEKCRHLDRHFDNCETLHDVWSNLTDWGYLNSVPGILERIEQYLGSRTKAPISMALKAAFNEHQGVRRRIWLEVKGEEHFSEFIQRVDPLWKVLSARLWEEQHVRVEKLLERLEKRGF